MEPLVRPDLTRVVLTGSESVGKTTLAGLLAAHYRVECVPEFVREYARTKGAPLDFRDHGPIAHGQMALEQEYIARADTLLIQDTDLVSTVVYCHHYFDRCPAFIEDAAAARRATLYLLLDTDIPWVPDGIRDREHRRDEVQALFVDTLHAMHASVVTVRGDFDERLRASVRAIDLLLLERHLPLS